MTLAYILKLAGLFSKEDKKTLSNLIFYVTLPASLISGFTYAKVNIYYIVAILTGFGVNTVMVIAGQIASRNKSRELQAIYAVNASGYNMACIAIPFLSNFYPGGVPYLCMFDVGDSFYTLGTTYALAQVRLNQGSNTFTGIKICNRNSIGYTHILYTSSTTCHEADISGSSILIKCGRIYNIFRKIRSANRYSSSTQSNLYNMYDTAYGYCYNANNVGMVLTE